MKFLSSFNFNHSEAFKEMSLQWAAGCAVWDLKLPILFFLDEA